MHQRHDMKIFPKQGELLIKWHFRHPPQAEEKRRNDLIERLQGNRNPFIDRPERARKLDFSRRR